MQNQGVPFITFNLMKCQYCQGLCVKKGCYKSNQLYRCKNCAKYQRFNYKKPKIQTDKKEWVKSFTVEGLGTSSISRLLRISKSSVSRIIHELSQKITKPTFEETNQEYEIDELRTFSKNKKNECWISYAINKKTKRVIEFVVGRRNKTNIKKIIDAILSLNPKKIFTDKLNIYKSLISSERHQASAYKINHIERMNLNLRTHLIPLAHP